MSASGKPDRKVSFECTTCGAVDSTRLYENESVPPVINCWQCHAGREMTLDKMMQHKKGMFVTGVELESAGA